MQRPYPYSPTRRFRVRIVTLAGASSLFLVLSVGSLQAKIGDVLDTFAPRFGWDNYWGFCEATGHYHGIWTEGVRIFDRNGTLLTTGTRRFAVTTDGSRGMVVVDDNTWMILERSGGTIATWRLGREPNGDFTGTKISTIDLSPHLSGTQSVRSFARASNGTFWLAVSGVGLIHVTSNGSTELERLESADLKKVFGISGFGMRNEALAVEQVTDSLLIRAHSSSDDNMWVYYVDPDGPTLLGRARLPIPKTEVLDHWVGANGALLATDRAQTYRIQIEEAVLPKVGEVWYNPEGVFWTGCSTVNSQSYSIRGVWGGGGPSGFIISREDSFSNMNETFVLNGNAVDSTYNPSGLADALRRAGRDYIIKDLHLINGDGQISGLITLPLNISAYTGGVLGSPAVGSYPSNCGLWSRTLESSVSGTVAKWTASLSVPAEALDSKIGFPSWFPWIGGREFGVEEIQLTAESQMLSKGQGFASLVGGGRLLLGSGFIGAKLGGGAKTELKPDGLQYINGSAVVEISGGVKEEVGLLAAFPTLAPLKSLWGIGRVFVYLDQRAKLAAEIRVEMLSKPQLVSDLNGDLAFGGEIGGALVLNAAANVELWRGVAEASAYAEARAQINYVSEPTTYSLEFADFTLQGLAGYNVVIYGAKWTGERVLSIKYKKDGTFEAPPPPESQVLSSRVEYAHGSMDGTKQKDVPQPYIITPNPFEQLERMGPANPLGKSLEVPVVGNLPADASPFTAFGPGGTMMVVWQQEVVGNPATQATDIYYSYFNGASFSPPAPISTDTNADFHPKVAYHKSGVWVALWERVGSLLTPTGDPIADVQAQIRRMVAAYSVFDPATGAWTTPAFLGSPTSYMVKLATGPTHDITACWLESPGPELFPMAMITGDTVQGSNTMYYAHFAGPTFDAAQLAYIASSIVDYGAADNGTEVRVAVSQVLDWTRDTGWFETVIRTYAHAHDSPQASFTHLNSLFGQLALGPEVVAMNDGTWRVAWKQFQSPYRFRPDYKINPSIFMTDDLTSLPGAELLYQDKSLRQDRFNIPIEDPGRWGAYPLDEFKLSDAGNGQVFLVFKDIVDGEPDMRLVFDDAAGTPSAAAALLEDGALEKAANLTVGAGGELLVTYHKSDLQRTTKTVDIGGVPTDLVSITEAPTGVLTFLQQNVGRDLTVGEVALRGGLVQEGTTLTLEVEIESLGALSVQDPAVSIFAKQIYPPPSPGGGDLFELVSDFPFITGLMAGFSKETLEFQWVFPGGIYQLYAMVDPQGRIQESDEQNNVGPLSVVGVEYPESSASSWRLYR